METLIYCRVSSKEQAETGYSLHQQEQASKKFIEKSGFVLGKIFIESGESAKTQDRTELQKMLKYMKSNVGHVTGLVVWKLDRLSRELYDFKSLELRLSKMGIMIHSVTEPNDLNAVGKLSRNMTASFAQFENDQKSERTIAVMQQACKDGRWCWKAPLGYKRVKEKGHSIIAIDTENAIYVQKAFEMAETNTYSKEEIRRELQAMGLPNLKKDKLTKMLNNVLYMGKLKVSWFPNLIDAIHEPIITKSQFYKVQKIMLARRKGGINKSSNNSEFPLKKILRCGLCGERITGSKSTGGGGSKYAYYHCSSKKNCSIRTPKAELEEKFYCLLNDMILRDNALKATIASITSEFDSQKKRQQQLIKQIKGEMQREKQRKNRLLDFMLDGTLGEDDAKVKMKEIDENLLSYEAKLEANKLEDIEIKILINKFKLFSSNFGDWWLNTMDIKIKEQIQSIIFPNSVFWDGKVFRTGKTPLFMRLSGDLNTPMRQWYPRADSNG